MPPDERGGALPGGVPAPGRRRVLQISRRGRFSPSGRYPGQLSLPVLRTFWSSVLALLTVEAKLAPFISDFTIVGMT